MTSRRALLGVDDKEGLPEFARGIHQLGFELVATGGTEQALLAAGLPVTPVAEVTGVEEMLGGRVKTLHPAIHAGILARRGDPEDLATLARLGYQPIDLVVVNLYPFAQVAAKESSEAAVLEAIDIGGPTLLRAAAKNFASVAVVSSPEQYQWVLAELRGGGLSPDSSRRLAAEVFRLVSAYDTRVAQYLAGEPPRHWQLLAGQSRPPRPNCVSLFATVRTPTKPARSTRRAASLRALRPRYCSRGAGSLTPTGSMRTPPGG